MDLYPYFAALEATALSVWLRESPSLMAYPLVLILHTVGMGFLVGSNIAMDLRILGFAPGVPLSTFEGFFPVMRAGFVVNTISGVLLTVAYPTKTLTNPMFYLKLALIAAALIETYYIRDRVLRKEGADGRWLAGTSLFFWLSAVTAGRLLAYTYRHLLAGI